MPSCWEFYWDDLGAGGGGSEVDIQIAGALGGNVGPGKAVGY